MSRAGYSVTGTAKVAEAIDKLARDAGDVSRPSTETLAIGRDAARDAAPARTGALAGSITARADPGGGELATSIAYGPYQEFGTRWVQAQRFMRAGYDAMESSASDPFTRHLESAVASAQKG